MASEIDPVVLELIAKVDTYRADLKKAEGANDQLGKSLDSAAGKINAAAGKIDAAAAKMMVAFERASASSQKASEATQKAAAAKANAEAKAQAAIAAGAKAEAAKANASATHAKVEESARSRAQRAAERAAAAAQKAADQEKRAQEQAARAAQKAARDKEVAAKRAEDAMRKSSERTSAALRNLAVSFGAAFSVRQLGSVIDSFTRLQNNLRVAGLEGEKLASVQGQLLELSTRYGSSVEGLSSVFLKASLAQQSLGASTQDIIRLNEIVSASLRVTGTSAQEAQGALLQLGQALGSGVVRAEEFNSILEGAFPLAQAAARGIEGFAGDVAKLRIAIADGKITSQQFFQGVLKGGVDTLAQAEKATMTLSGAFEALSSRFTVYVGEASRANGVTSALASAIGSLADNLDTIIPALATIAGLIGVKYAAALVRSIALKTQDALATARKTVALNAENAALATNIGLLNAQATASARAAAATTGLAGSAKVAGTALLGAFGGPVGIAITGVALALGYVATKSIEARNAAAQLDNQYAESEQQLNDMIAKLDAAGIKTDDLKRATDRARPSIDSISDSYKRAAAEARKLGEAAGWAGVQVAQQRIQEEQDRQAVLRRTVQAYQSANPGAIREGRKSDGIVKAERQLAESMQEEARQRALIVGRTRAMQAGVSLTDSPSAPAATATEASKKKQRVKKAEDADARLYEAAQRMRDAMMDEADARLQLATNAQDRADLEFELLGLERDQQFAALEEAKRKKEIGQGEYEARKEILDKLYGQAQTESENGELLVQGNNSLYAQLIHRRQMEQELRDEADLARQEHDLRQDILRHEYDMTANRSDRLRIAKEMIDNDIIERRSQIDRQLLNKGIDDALRKRLELERASLEGLRQRRYRSAESDHLSPLEAYRKEITDTANNMNDEYEKIAVSGLTALNDGLTDAIMNSKNLGDVFKNVAKQIIADLIRIAIQQTIVNNLASAFNMGGGGGGFLGGLFGGGGGIFGRASGGHVNAGQVYRVKEAGMEFFQPANSGNIIPLGEMNAKISKAAPQGGVVRIMVEEGPRFASTVRAEATGVAVEVVRQAAPSIIQAGANEAQRNMTRPNMGRTF